MSLKFRFSASAVACAFAAALISSLLSSPAQAAATLYWDPLTTGGSASGGPGSWDTTSTFWSNGVSSDSAWSNASGASTTAVFGGSGGAVSVNAGITVGAITFNGAGYDLAGAGAITLGNGTNGTILVNQNAEIDVPITVPTVPFIVNGNSTLTLTNTTGVASSFAGGVLLNGGTLDFGAGALGPGKVVNFNGLSQTSGVLQWAVGNTQDVSAQFNAGSACNIDTNTNNVTFASALPSGYALTKLGAGSLTIGANTYTGGTTVTSGSLVVSGVSGWYVGTGLIRGAVNIGPNGTLVAVTTVSNSNSVLGTGGAASVSTLNINGGMLYNGSSSAFGNLGQQLFNATATMTGGTIDGPDGWQQYNTTLTIEPSSNSAYINSPYAANGTCPINVVGGSVPGGADLVVNGQFLGNGFVKRGTGTMILANTSSANYNQAGGMTISAGTVAAATAYALGTTGYGYIPTITLGDANTTANNSSATLAWSGNYTYYGEIVIANQPTSGTYTLAGVAPGANPNVGNWILAMQNLNLAAVSGGSLNLGNHGVSASGGQSVMVTFSGPGTVLCNGLSDTSTYSTGTSTGKLGVNVTGGFAQLTGADAYSGPTNITGGTLQCKGSTSLAPATALTIGANGVLDLGGNSFTQTSSGFALNGGTLQNGTLSYNGTYTSTGGSISATLNGSAGLAMNGPGSLVLTQNNNAYTGGTTVTSGTLMLTGASNWASGVIRGVVTIGPNGTLITQPAAGNNSLFGHGFGGNGGYQGVSTLNLNGGLLYNNSTSNQIFPGTLYMTGGTMGGATNGWQLENGGVTPSIVVQPSANTAYINMLSTNDGVGDINVVGGSARAARTWWSPASLTATTSLSRATARWS